MTTTIAISEREKVKQLADQYRNQGYDVIFKPSSDILPEFIQNYRPDLLLNRNDESVIVEVKSHSELDIATSQYLRDLAEKINQHQGWRFELIMTNSQKSIYDLKPQQSLQEDEIKSGLLIVHALTEVNLDSALLYTWSLLEATLRLIIQRENLRVEKFDSLTLITKLTFEGLLGRDQYHLLMSLESVRNAVAHGFKACELSKENVINLIDLIEELLADLDHDL